MKSNATVLAFAATLLLCVAGAARAQEDATLPEGEGKALVGAVCSQCHNLGSLFFLKADDRKWEILVHDMVSFGAQLSPDERDVIMRYLKASFSSDAGRAADGATSLPTGKGREVVEASCGACHGLSVVARKRAARPAWEAILRRHTTEKRVELSSADTDSVLAYLAASFAVATPKR